MTFTGSCTERQAKFLWVLWAETAQVAKRASAEFWILTLVVSQLQPGPGLRPVWRRRKPLVLQLLLLQQETEEDCVSHVPLRQVRAVLLVRAK